MYRMTFICKDKYVKLRFHFTATGILCISSIRDSFVYMKMILTHYYYIQLNT